MKAPTKRIASVRNKRVGHRRNLDAELLGDVLEQKGQEEEIEGVEHPAEEGGEDGLLLLPVRFIVALPPLLRAFT